jgi:hypothetical protein
VRCRRIIVRTSTFPCSDGPAGRSPSCLHASMNLGTAVGEPYSLPDLDVACLDKHRKLRRRFGDTKLLLRRAAMRRGA